ncbi:hypothetical protein AZI86_15145 [Bdellovibrio bacteriovorus]|uniref:Uncharacterized protein n=1 Tax=Bdellovibrio bacteriovorus TaxID=959 RepID=A0A150WHG6_BDEBC|nr:hypothetical protein [Bdellovibrio bacteriovorus]KYG63054.1 hypothetical protein AZI86_15145 [Bdellovibrio bacteriovorus]
MSTREIFKKLTEELASFLEKEGVVVRPYSDPQMFYFRKMSDEQQRETISGLKHFLSAVKRVLLQGKSLKDAEFFVKTALNYFGVEPHPEFQLRAYDIDVVVEFYSLKGLQLFRTFNYFELTSYTLEDIYCRPWHDLYERPEDFSENMFGQIEKMVSEGNAKESLLFGSHTIKERLSLERLEIFCDGMHVAPLVRGGKIVAISSLVACRPLERADRQVVI